MNTLSLRQRTLQALAFVHAALEDASGRYAAQAHLFLDECRPALRRRTLGAGDLNELLLLAELDRASRLLDLHLGRAR